MILTFDPRLGQRFWFEDYFFELWSETHRSFPPLEDVVSLVGEATGAGSAEVSDFRLPHDLRDKFAAAGWRRPWLYLDGEVRAGISAFALAEQQGSRKASKGCAGICEAGRGTPGTIPS